MSSINIREVSGNVTRHVTFHLEYSFLEKSWRRYGHAILGLPAIVRSMVSSNSGSLQMMN